MLPKNVLIFLDGRKNFPLVMVGGVLEVDNEWDMYTEVVSRIVRDFPGVQPIRPEVSHILRITCVCLFLRSTSFSVLIHKVCTGV